MRRNSSQYDGKLGFFSFDAAVALISLLLIVHAISSAHAHFSSQSLSLSHSLERQSAILQTADFLIKEGAAIKSDSAFPASSFASHHEISSNWDSDTDAQGIAKRMGLAYLGISTGGAVISTSPDAPSHLYCISRIALYKGEITKLEVCGA
jgi:hypothetical protein